MLTITLLALLILTLVGKKSFDLYLKKNVRQDDVKKGLTTILFIGSLSFAVGMLGQTMGIYQMLKVISGSTRDIPAQIIAAGLQMSMIPTLYGLIVLIISACFWFVLHSRSKQILRSVSKPL